MKNIDNLIRQTWSLFTELKEDPKLSKCIIDTMPILYFGDYKAYKKSKIEIVTVSLNPSDNEFPKDDKNQYSFCRFPEAKKLRGKKKLNNEDLKSYKDSLNQYYKKTHIRNGSMTIDSYYLKF